jgi:hypothetical protein
VIAADTIDRAVDKVLDELKEDAAGTTSSRHNVIYFDGWDGLGASAVLRAVGRRLTPQAGTGSSGSAAAGLGLTHVFHIDCSKWESRRAMQKMIAEQLKLPDSVMDMFDAQDEDDNYLGIGKGSRAEIPRVAEEINGQIQKLNGRFLLIFHNGSNEEIDLGILGFPLFDRYSKSKVLWSFQGRFRAYPRTKVDGALKNTTLTDVFLSAEYSSNIDEDEFSEILHHEAEEVAREMINPGDIDWPAATVNCFLYTMKLCRMDNDLTDYDLATHVCNYWTCDGIIQLQQGDVGNDDGVDKMWLSCDALRHELRLDADNYRNPHFSSRVERRLLKREAYWTSPTYGVMWILDPHGQIPEGMFQQFNKLSVLKLSACEFSFASPPFLCCQNLRFLYLDRCQEGSSTDEAVKGDEERSSTDEAVKEDDTRQFLQRLWVLDVRYSKGAFLSQDTTHLRELNVVGEVGRLDMALFRGQLCNIRKLRVTKFQSFRGNEVLFSGMEKLELLEFSQKNESGQSVCLTVENCNNLETVIIDGSTRLREIYLMGCPKLKNLFLIGSFPNLNCIGIAGGAVEILDLSSGTAPELYGLFLHECEKLCAILWPSSAERKRNTYLSRLWIDMKQKEGGTADTSRPPGGLDYWRMAVKKINFDCHISVRDARILQSLEPVKGSFGSKDAHVEVSTISSPAHPCADAAADSKDGGMRSSRGQQVKLKQPKDTAMYPDVAVALKETRTQKQQEEEANEGHSGSDALGTMCICPPHPDLPPEGCYLNIEDHLRTRSQAASVTLPGFICDRAKILHVHDSLHATSILEVPSGSTTWNQLEWCRVERCPKLECVFGPLLGGRMAERSKNDRDMFNNLKTVWASDLPNARYIWNQTWTDPWSSMSWYGPFEGLALLHVDCCPRLINIARFPRIHDAFDRLERLARFPRIYDAFDRLERLEIMWCSDLSVAFYFYYVAPRCWWKFNKLKHVYLHELPNLQNIINFEWIYMPELQTIKIRGCWSLKRLPIIESANMVECDCEKEWWDGLEWESEEHKRQYKKAIHPRYYKKTMLRGSALR